MHKPSSGKGKTDSVQVLCREEKKSAIIQIKIYLFLKKSPCVRYCLLRSVMK